MKLLELSPLKRDSIEFKTIWDNETEEIFLAETVIKFNLLSGKDYTDTEIIEVSKYDEMRRCIQQALRLLNRRFHGKKEIEQKLRNRDFSGFSIEQTLEYLTSQGFLNDRKFSEKYLHDRLLKKKLGQRAALLELLKKGIPENISKMVVEQQFKNLDEETIGLTLAEKKWRTFREPDPHKRKQKLIRFLMQRGFEFELANQLANQISKK